MTSIFFATDVHGSEKTFRKFTNAAKFYGVDALILGGDLTGKMVVPVIKQSDNTYWVDYLGTVCFAKTDEELKALEKSINDSGYYAFRTDSREMDSLSRVDIDQIFIRLMRERLISWIELVEQRLKGSGIQVYLTGGNDDPLEIEDILDSSNYVINAQGKVCRIDEFHEMISSGLSNPTPWKTRREVSEDRLTESIDAMVTQIKDVKNSIFNFHSPPKDSQLDTCRLLDGSVYPPKPVFRSGQFVTYGAGSTAVRASIEKYQPILGLFGHIHEGRGVIRIGRTLCINAGSEYSQGTLTAAIIVLDKERIISHQLTCG